MYRLCYQLMESGRVRCGWLAGVQTILDDLGLSNFWQEQAFPSQPWLMCIVKQRLKDQALQSWSLALEESSKCSIYRIFKQDNHFEEYLDELPRNLAISLCKFRTSCHALPIERGRYTRTPRHQRICTKCTARKVGDEYHFILECSALKELRRRYIPTAFSARPNTVKFCNLMQDSSLQLKISRFVKKGLEIYV